MICTKWTLILALLVSSILPPTTAVGFRSSCAHSGSISNNNEEIGCPCAHIGKPCRSQFSICQNVSGRGICECRSPAVQLGASCTAAPCAITFANPAKVFVSFDFCAPDGTKLCSNSIIISGCASPVHFSTKLFYGFELRDDENINPGSDTTTYLNHPLFVAQQDSQNSASIVIANQQLNINLQQNAGGASNTGYQDFQCGTFTAFDALGRTATSPPICVNVNRLYGQDMNENYCTQQYFPVSNFYSQCETTTPGSAKCDPAPLAIE